jgi:hypothetical protein
VVTVVNQKTVLKKATTHREPEPIDLTSPSGRPLPYWAVSGLKCEPDV